MVGWSYGVFRTFFRRICFGGEFRVNWSVSRQSFLLPLFRLCPSIHSCVFIYYRLQLYCVNICLFAYIVSLVSYLLCHKSHTHNGEQTHLYSHWTSPIYLIRDNNPTEILLASRNYISTHIHLHKLLLIMAMALSSVGCSAPVLSTSLCLCYAM